MGFNPFRAVADTAKSAYEISTGPINPFSLGRFGQGNPHIGGGSEGIKPGDFASAFGPQNLIPQSFIPQKSPPLGGTPNGPNRASATLFANNQVRQDMQRRQQSQTLFTSGQGLLDAPLIASALLLGS